MKGENINLYFSPSNLTTSSQSLQKKMNIKQDEPNTYAYRTEKLDCRQEETEKRGVCGESSPLGVGFKSRPAHHDYFRFLKISLPLALHFGPFLATW